MRLDIREITCRNALNRVRGMPFKWSLNPYRGCSHACWYCYARETHTYFDLNGGRDFERVIFAKINVAERLRAQVRSPRWKRETVAVGAATDPYQPVEGHLRLTQACLREFLAARSPIGLITKSTLIRRDRHLLQELARAAGVSVTVSIPIADPHLARRIEPGVPPPAERFRVVRELADLSLDVGVNMAPVLPGLTDSDAAIAELMRLAREHGARRVGTRMLHLKPEPKRWFLHNLRRYFPHLEPLYVDLYPRGVTYVDNSVDDDLEARANALRDFIGPAQSDTPALAPPPAPIQLPLASGF
ncbi:MAG: radical SAM protein [Chloroflexi bacterium]|nr:radical SAM protein [Chloroflexota bacterium]